jgi:hypothetical protein
LKAYTRFAARYGHPLRLYLDEGTQLVKAATEMSLSWMDVSRTLSSQFQVGIKHVTSPVSGHNYTGVVERSIREIRKLFTAIFPCKIKMDLLSFETAFAFVANSLNNLPLCLGENYRDLGELDLLTPNRLILGRNNRRAMSGPCTVEKPSRMLDTMDAIHQAWWKVWGDERLTRFVAQPPKWLKSDPNLKVGDIVIFRKKESELTLKSSVWSIGRVVVADPSSKDGVVRDVTIEYKNASESKFRQTHRAARSVAVLHKEGDIEFTVKLAKASREASCAFLNTPPPSQRNTTVPNQEMDGFDWSEELESYSCLSKECGFIDTISSVCNILSIHTDPWL